MLEPNPDPIANTFCKNNSNTKSMGINEVPAPKKCPSTYASLSLPLPAHFGDFYFWKCPKKAQSVL